MFSGIKQSVKKIDQKHCSKQHYQHQINIKNYKWNKNMKGEGQGSKLVVINNRTTHGENQKVIKWLQNHRMTHFCVCKDRVDLCSI